MFFSSKKDWVYGSVFWGSTGLFLIIPFFEIDGPGLFYLKAHHPIRFLVLYSFVIVFLWIWFGTNYKIEKNHLYIKYGPFKKVIPISSIRRVRMVKNPLTGAVLSMDKIEIMYDKYEMISVSPKNQQTFIDCLTRENAAIDKTY